MRTLPEHVAYAVTNRGLKLIINTTEQCNLRCTYCYETFSLRAMAPPVVQGIICLVQRRAEAGLDWLEIEFFGGEPLAAWNVIQTLARQLNDICCTQQIRLLGAITTNGTLLTRNRLDFLVKNQFKSFQITLDGPAFLHDSRRKTVAGAGTFDRILACLEMIKSTSYDLDIMLRVHFDSVSTPILLESDFIDQLNLLLLKDHRFQLHFKPLENWSGVAQNSIVMFENHAAEARALTALLENALARGVPTDQLPQLASQSVATGESGHVVCYAARANSFVIRSDGRLSKCTVAFSDDRNIVGRLLPDGQMVIDHNRHLPWLRGLISGDAMSLTCPAIGLLASNN